MKTNIKALISELSVVEKIELLDCLYHELSGHGTDGDTELAHINTREAAVLKALGGSGTVNEITGLRQYGKGSPPPPPSSQTVEQKIPEEISPYIKDILAKGQAIQEQRTAEGYQPYQGPQLAEFTPEQQQAFTGISGLVGTGQQYFDPAARLTAAAAMQPTGQEVSQYMSPYMQQVVDIQKREAERQADVAGQQLASQAVTAGGFGGSRQAILEAEAARNLQTQLGDIQAKGLAAAYEDAQARLAAQRQRQLASGAQFAQMAPSALQTALQEQTALQQVGGLKQAQSQAALDIAKGQFEAEKTFPEQTLQQYSSLIRGYAMPPSTTTVAQTPAPTYLQQLAGLGATAYGASKLGIFKEGGQVGDGTGIASIIVKRKKGGKVIKLADGSEGDTIGEEEEDDDTGITSAASKSTLQQILAKRLQASKNAPGEAILGFGLNLLTQDPTKAFLSQVGESAKEPLKTYTSAKEKEIDTLLKIGTLEAKGAKKSQMYKLSQTVDNNLSSFAAAASGFGTRFDPEGYVVAVPAGKGSLEPLSPADKEKFEENKRLLENFYGAAYNKTKNEAASVSYAKQAFAAYQEKLKKIKESEGENETKTKQQQKVPSKVASPALGSYVPKRVTKERD